MTASTLYPNCDEWYDGLFAVAYKDLWSPLYYGIVLGALFCNWAFYVIGVVFTGRVFWAMGQEYILLNKSDGSMIIPSEYDIISNRMINDNDRIEQERMDITTTQQEAEETKMGYDDDDQQQQIGSIETEYTKINIGILPAAFGRIWPKTGSPVLGVIVQSVIASLACLIPDYYAWTEFLMFMYALTFFAVVGSFLILKYKEPNLMRPYEVPCGKIGAWACSISCLAIIVVIDVILAVGLWEMFLYSLESMGCSLSIMFYGGNVV